MAVLCLRHELGLALSSLCLQEHTLFAIILAFPVSGLHFHLDIVIRSTPDFMSTEN